MNPLSAQSPLTIGDLVSHLHGQVVGSIASNNLPIRLVTHNSAWVQPGDVFVALQGKFHDGHNFITSALNKGAVAVIGSNENAAYHCPLPYVLVEDDRQAIALASAFVHNQPAKALFTLGVTGTDGKTTTTFMTLFALRSLGISAGCISTLGYQLCVDKLLQPPQHFTTPEAPQVHQTLHDMLDDISQNTNKSPGAMVLEVSSEALHSKRVYGIEFDVAIWTQITCDHLNTHGTFENYFACKQLLIKNAKTAVLNADDPMTEQLIGIAKNNVWYALREHINKPTDLSDSQWRKQLLSSLPVWARSDDAWIAYNVKTDDKKVSAIICTPYGDFSLTIPMPGAYNIANALGALLGAWQIAITCDKQQGIINKEDYPQLLTKRLTNLCAQIEKNFKGVPGRMEVIADGPNVPTVIIDYAHTAGSVNTALHTVKTNLKPGQKLWAVLGSPGRRDEGRRRPIGRSLGTYADVAVLTEDNSRGLDPLPIINDIKAGCDEVDFKNVFIIPNRNEALSFAICNADVNDVVMVGFGIDHTLEREPGKLIDWDEYIEVEKALLQRKQLK